MLMGESFLQGGGSLEFFHCRISSALIGMKRNHVLCLSCSRSSGGGDFPPSSLKDLGFRPPSGRDRGGLAINFGTEAGGTRRNPRPVARGPLQHRLVGCCSALSKKGICCNRAGRRDASPGFAGTHLGGLPNELI